MDFSAKTGTPIYATGDGRVVRADNRAAGFGNHVRINHGFGYESIYAHMSKITVKRGYKVKRGDLIGYVGNTGRSVAPHLHYEIIKDGKNGILVEEDANALANAIDKVVDNKTLRIIMSENGRKFVEENFSIDSVGPVFVQEYKKLMYKKIVPKYLSDEKNVSRD